MSLCVSRLPLSFIQTWTTATEDISFFMFHHFTLMNKLYNIYELVVISLVTFNPVYLERIRRSFYHQSKRLLNHHKLFWCSEIQPHLPLLFIPLFFHFQGNELKVLVSIYNNLTQLFWGLWLLSEKCFLYNMLLYNWSQIIFLEM